MIDARITQLNQRLDKLQGELNALRDGGSGLARQRLRLRLHRAAKLQHERTTDDK